MSSEQICGCKHSDAWRCAVARTLPTVSCHCSCHRTATEVNAVQEAARVRDKQERAQLMTTIDFSNRHMLSAGKGGKALAFLNPPTRAHTMTPEEALVLAAWLVAMAEPFAQVTFSAVLDEVTSH